MLSPYRMPATKPISERRLAANRANARRSTGPRTAAGKARSARNAHKHGLAAAGRASAARLQEAVHLETLRAGAIAVYQPANSQELFAVERIALAQAAISHCAALEAGILSDAIGQCADPTASPALALAIGFQRLVAGSNAFSLFLRYQAQAERQYRRAVEEFHRLGAIRNELPNEPIACPEPQRANTLTNIASGSFEPARPPVPPPAPRPWRPASDCTAGTAAQPLPAAMAENSEPSQGTLPPREKPGKSLRAAADRPPRRDRRIAGA